MNTALWIAAAWAAMWSLTKLAQNRRRHLESLLESWLNSELEDISKKKRLFALAERRRRKRAAEETAVTASAAAAAEEIARLNISELYGEKQARDAKMRQEVSAIKTARQGAA